MPSADDPVVAEVLRRLIAAYEPERVYLFGSSARGDFDPISTTTSFSSCPTRVA